MRTPPGWPGAVVVAWWLGAECAFVGQSFIWFAARSHRCSSQTWTSERSTQLQGEYLGRHFTEARPGDCAVHPDTIVYVCWGSGCGRCP